MDLTADWAEIRGVFVRAQRSGLHQAFATVAPDGSPHVTPIGSLSLHPQEPRGIYLDLFNQQLSKNLDRAPRVSVLAVDAHYTMWLGALLRGRFSRAPGVRLFGVASERRRAREEEVERFQRRFRRVRFTRGYQLLWGRFEWVRDITFERVEPVRIGAMTRSI
jgi:hypothetical protein